MTHTSSTPARAFELGIIDVLDSSSPVEGARNLLEAVELADRVGLDVFAVAEHHRSEALSVSPVVILGAAAARTTSIRLSAAITVLGTDDLLRVCQNLISLDLLSNGRAEIMIGHRPFPDLPRGENQASHEPRHPTPTLNKLPEAEHIDWAHKLRTHASTLPLDLRAVQTDLPVWVAANSLSMRVMQAASMSLPLALTITGGLPERIAPLFHLHRESARTHAFTPPSLIPLSLIASGLVADDSRVAVDAFSSDFAAALDHSKPPGDSSTPGQPPMPVHHRHGAYYVGSPAEVIDKILLQHEMFQHQRIILYLDGQHIDHALKLRAIELLGTQVAPVVRAEIARRTTFLG